MRECRGDKSPVALCSGIIPGEGGVVHQELLYFGVTSCTSVHPASEDCNVQSDDGVYHQFRRANAIRLISSIVADGVDRHLVRIYGRLSGPFGRDVGHERLW